MYPGKKIRRIRSHWCRMALRPHKHAYGLNCKPGRHLTDFRSGRGWELAPHKPTYQRRFVARAKGQPYPVAQNGTNNNLRASPLPSGWVTAASVIEALAPPRQRGTILRENPPCGVRQGRFTKTPLAPTVNRGTWHELPHKNCTTVSPPFTRSQPKLRDVAAMCHGRNPPCAPAN